MKENVNPKELTVLTGKLKEENVYNVLKVTD